MVSFGSRIGVLLKKFRWKFSLFYPTTKMTETVPRWIIYWCVHIHSQGKLNEWMWMNQCEDEWCYYVWYKCQFVMFYLAWDREINISLFSCDDKEWVLIHCFRLFAFKSIRHEVNNLVSTSRSVFNGYTAFYLLQSD